MIPLTPPRWPQIGPSALLRGRYRGVYSQSDDTAPAPLAGHTLLWREMFATLGEVDSGNPYGFTAVTDGTGYARPIGPRDATYPDQPGWSMRVPNRSKIAGTPTVCFQAYKAFDAVEFIQYSGWFRFAGVGQGRCYVLRLFNGTTPLFGVTAEWKTFGTDDITIKMDDGVNGASGSADVKLNEWIWLALVAHTPDTVGGSGTKVWKVYYRRHGDASPTLLSSQDIGGSDPGYVVNRAYIRAARNDLADVDPWHGAVGGLSIIECDSLDTAALYPRDLIKPTEQQHRFWVDTESGDDSNSGYGESQAWETAEKVLQELDIGTFLGYYKSWTDGSGNDAGILTVTDGASQETWEEQYQLGNRRTKGSLLVVDSTAANPLLFTPGMKNLNMENIPGFSICGATPNAVISARVDLSGETWVQDSGSGSWAGTNPNIWFLAMGDMRVNATGALVVEDNTLMVPLNADDESEVLSTMEEGECHTTTAGIYIWPFGDTNPNSDGKTRTCGAPFLQSSSGSTGPGLVALGSGECYDFAEIDMGPLGPMGDADVEPFYALSFRTNQVGAARDLTLRGGVKHACGLVGTEASGFAVRSNITFREFYLAGQAITDVLFSGYTGGAAAIGGVWRGCHTTPGAAFHQTGQEPADTLGITFLYMHGDGATGNLFTLVKIVDCTMPGVLNFSLCHTGAVSMTDTEFSGYDSDSDACLVDRCLLNTWRINVYGGDTLFRNSIVREVPGSAYGGDCVRSGALTFEFCTLDLRNYDFGGSGGAVWGDDADVAFTIENSAVLVPSGGSAPLIAGAEAADDIDVSRTAFLGHSNPTLLASYNDGSTTANRTYLQCVGLGLITSSAASETIGLDDEDDYSVEAGSPVIQLAAAASDTVDYTGDVFATRDDAGARESSFMVSAPVAEFSGTPTSGDSPLTVQFTDESTNVPTSWAWDFGDGGTSTEQNPAHEYEEAGTYTVSLTVENIAGDDSEVKTNYITAIAVSTPANAMTTPTGDYLVTPNGDYLVHP